MRLPCWCRRNMNAGWLSDVTCDHDLEGHTHGNESDVRGSDSGGDRLGNRAVDGGRAAGTGTTGYEMDRGATSPGCRPGTRGPQADTAVMAQQRAGGGLPQLRHGYG